MSWAAYVHPTPHTRYDFRRGQERRIIGVLDEVPPGVQQSFRGVDTFDKSMLVLV